MFWLKKEPHISQILLKLWLIGNRTSRHPIRSVIILVIKQIRLPLRGGPILSITCMITDRIGLHSVLLPLLSTLRSKNQGSYICRCLHCRIRKKNTQKHFYPCRLSVSLMWTYCDFTTVTGCNSVKVPFIWTFYLGELHVVNRLLWHIMRKMIAK